MFSITWSRHLLTYALIVTGLVFVFSYTGGTAALAQDSPAFIRRVRVMEAERTGLTTRPGWLTRQGRMPFTCWRGARRGRRYRPIRTSSR